MTHYSTSTTAAAADTALLSTGVRMHYYDSRSPGRPVVLLHGFPETAWQWRLVMPLLAAGGYRVLAPDLRGAGHSSRPRRDEGVPADPRGPQLGGYDKRSLAADVFALLHEHLRIDEPAFVVGHDIGAMVAVAYAFRYREATRALCFGEAPLPGTRAYDELKGTVGMFHFNFHTVLDLPETLVTGREEQYLQHFYNKLGKHPTAIDTAHYVHAFRQPGALRAGFDLYRAFEEDAYDTRTALAEGGKLTMPVLAVHGEISAFGEVTGDMARELADDPQVAAIPDTGHWLAEENPVALTETLLRFDGAPAQRSIRSEPGGR